MSVIDQDIPYRYGLVLPRLDENDYAFLQQHATIKSYRRNYHVFSKGDDGDHFFLILEGQVEVYVENDTSRTLICRMGPGEFFGELSLLTGGPRTASVMTIEDSRFAMLRKSAFSECLIVRPTLWVAMVRQLVRLVSELTEKLSMLALDAYGRIRFFLYRLVREIDGELVVEGHWTQQHFAELAGCARETVAKIMTELKRGGWIRCERRRIVLLKPLPDRF